MIYLRLFFVFAKIGLFGFGGGMAMLPLIYQSAQEFNLMAPEEFSDLVALSQVTPGPIAVNAATYVGYQCAGYGGAFAATLGVALPSFLLVLAVTYCIGRFRESSVVAGAFAGIRPVTVGLVGAAVVLMAETVPEAVQLFSVIVVGVTIILTGKFKWNPVAIVVLSAVAGAVFCS